MIVYLKFLVAVVLIGEAAPKQEDLDFGKRQVEQVISDRPDIGKVINREPLIRQQIELCFAGASNGSRVYWDGREPMSGRQAEHLPAILGYPAFVRVTPKKEISAVDKCVMLIFELNNLEVDEQYQYLLSTPLEKRESRSDFALKCLLREYQANERTRSFLRKYPIREAKPDRDSVYYTTIGDFESFPDQLRRFNKLGRKEFNPLTHYEIAYDGFIFGPPVANCGESNANEANHKAQEQTK